jgi:hypothetical protein
MPRKKKYKVQAKREKLDRTGWTEEELAIPIEWMEMSCVENPKKFLRCPTCNTIINIGVNRIQWIRGKKTPELYCFVKCENGHVTHSTVLGRLLLNCGGVKTKEELENGDEMESIG